MKGLYTYEYEIEEAYSGTGLRERGRSGGLQDVGADARDELLEQLGRAERGRANFAHSVDLERVAQHAPQRRGARHEEHVRHEALAIACGNGICEYRSSGLSFWWAQIKWTLSYESTNNYEYSVNGISIPCLAFSSRIPRHALASNRVDQLFELRRNLSRSFATINECNYSRTKKFCTLFLKFYLNFKNFPLLYFDNNFPNK